MNAPTVVAVRICPWVWWYGEKRVKYSACAECEIIHFVNCEISPFGRCEMKFAHIRVSEYFTFAEQIFHSEAISLARRANFVEKSSFFRTSFFLAGMAGFEPTNAGVKVPCLTAWRHPNDWIPDYYTIVSPVCQQENPFRRAFFIAFFTEVFSAPRRLSPRPAQGPVPGPSETPAAAINCG